MADPVLAVINEQFLAGLLTRAEAEALRREHLAKGDLERAPRIVPKAIPMPSGYNPLDAVQAKSLEEQDRLRKAQQWAEANPITRGPSQEGVTNKRGAPSGARKWQPHQRFPDDLVRVYLVFVSGPTEGAIPRIAPAGHRRSKNDQEQALAQRIYWMRDEQGKLVRADQLELARIEAALGKGEITSDAASKLRIEAAKLAPRGGLLRVDVIDIVPPASNRHGSQKMARPLQRGQAMVRDHVLEGRGLAAVQFRRRTQREALAEVEAQIRKIGSKPKSQEAKDLLAELKAERRALKGKSGPDGICVCDHRGMELSHDDRMALEHLAPGIADRPGDRQEKEGIVFRCFLQGPICSHDPTKGRKPEGVSYTEWLMAAEAEPCTWIDFFDVEAMPMTDDPDRPGSGIEKRASELALTLSVGKGHSLNVATVQWTDPETGETRTVKRSDVLLDLPEEEDEYHDPWRDREQDVCDFMEGNLNKRTLYEPEGYEEMTVQERNRHEQYMLGKPRERRPVMHEPKVRIDYGEDGRQVWGNAHDSRKGKTWGRMKAAQG